MFIEPIQERNRPRLSLIRMAVGDLTPNLATDSFLIGRQPVFDSGREVWGFELLFRAPPGRHEDAETMTADVLLHAGLDLGLDRLAGTKRVLVNANRPYLVGEWEVPLPADRTVIEVLEDVERDPDVVEGCQRLKDEGFLLALDDYVWQPRDPLLPLADLVKLDVLAIEAEDLSEQVELCSAFGATLLAEKIETTEQLELCHRLGFELFQGYLLSRPDVVSGRAMSPSRLNCLRLVEQLADPDTGPKDVQRIIGSDPGLTLRFLRAAGEGAARGLSRPVRSIAEGAVLLGQRRMRSWGTLMLLSDASAGHPDQLCLAMVRGRLCELIADAVAPEWASAAFTVGILSALDVLMQVPLADVLAELSLADELVEAVLGRAGQLGAILSDALDWELGRYPSLASGIGATQMTTMAADAVRWADQLCSTLMDESGRG